MAKSKYPQIKYFSKYESPKTFQKHKIETDNLQFRIDKDKNIQILNKYKISLENSVDKVIQELTQLSKDLDDARLIQEYGYLYHDVPGIWFVSGYKSVLSKELELYNDCCEEQLNISRVTQEQIDHAKKILREAGEL